MNRGTNDAVRQAAASALDAQVRRAKVCEECGSIQGSGLGSHYTHCSQAGQIIQPEAVDASSLAETTKCAIGGIDDGTLRVCCSSHRQTLCAHHYARTHFVETMPAWQSDAACNAIEGSQ